MDPFHASLSEDQRMAFLSSMLSTLSLDQLLYVRNTLISAYITVKGGTKRAPRNRQVRQKIKLTKLNVAPNDTYETVRSDIIDAMGDAVSTRIYVDVEKREATVTFDSYEVADTAFARLEQRFPVVIML